MPQQPEPENLSDTLDGLVKTYYLYRKMVRYPRLIDEMRDIFVSALVDRGIITPEELEEKARGLVLQEGKTADHKTVRSCRNSLIDLLFAGSFGPDEVDAHVNLARKRDRFRVLQKVVNEERSNTKKITQALREFCDIPQGDLYISPNEAEGVRVILIDRFISNQLPFIGIGKHHLTIRDIDEMVDRIHTSRRRPGKIGGKAAGMLLAYKIVLPKLQKRDPDLEKYVTIPDSYYFNSGIFAEFIDHNGLYQFHSQKYKTRQTIEEEYKSIAQLFRKASFPSEMMDDFRDFLEKIGECPLILRSSSLLEDNFGHAFSGKYESIFLANQGDLETRLTEFVWGLKQVHMSCYGPSPILYRRDHNLLDFDEQMGVLVQKVVGRRFGDYFFPFGGGVAFSYNPCRWTPRIRKEDGLVRLVFGLGTRAVDRVGQDYPRMIPLSHPLLRPEIGAEQVMKYSQKMVDVINLRTRRLETVPTTTLLREIDDPDFFYAVSANVEGHLAAPLFRESGIDPDRSCLTFENFLTRTPVAGLLRKVLKKLETAYGNPVDIEFAWDDDKLYILQCRTLTVREGGKVSLPINVPPERTLFMNTLCLASAIVRNIEYIVYVDPKAYGRIGEHDEKIAVGRAVGSMNIALGDKRYALLGPGRWGSNDINLGVRVGYADINHTLILGEIAFEEKGLTPEASCGTHFFNDLVEAEIVPVVIYPDQPEDLFSQEFLVQSPNLLSSLAPEFARFEDVVHVIHVPSCTDGRLLHVFQDSASQKGIAFFDHAGNAVGNHSEG